jgi:type IV secretory pathway VirB2 component (pilin)
MSKNLETADMIVKMTLSVLIVIFYFADIISGPFARLLMILAFLILGISAMRKLKK